MCLKALRHWTKKAGIDKHITWHCGRHSFGTQLLNNGANIKVVSSLLGHSSLRFTEIYVRACRGEAHEGGRRRGVGSTGRYHRHVRPTEQVKQLTNEARAEGKLACTMPCKEEEGDSQQIEALYKQMYRAMIAKDMATLNLVHAAVFKGGRHTWQLQLRFQLVKHDGRWLFTAASASTY